jgi:hypothetical protein
MRAKSGDAAIISGYLGKADVFDRAIGEFPPLAYADQNESDHAALLNAVKERLNRGTLRRGKAPGK